MRSRFFGPSSFLFSWFGVRGFFRAELVFVSGLAVCVLGLSGSGFGYLAGFSFVGYPHSCHELIPSMFLCVVSGLGFAAPGLDQFR